LALTDPILKRLCRALEQLRSGAQFGGNGFVQRQTPLIDPFMASALFLLLQTHEQPMLMLSPQLVDFP